MKMAKKTIASYLAPRDSDSNRSLQIHIGPTHIACAVTENDRPMAFEYFELEEEITAGNDLFYELKQDSQILTQHYQEVKVCYYGIQSLIVPQEKMNTEAADDYLTLLFGQMPGYHTKQEKIDVPANIFTVYRLDEAIHDHTLRHFPLHHTQHVYTTALQKLLSRRDIGGSFMQVSGYHDHILVILLKEEALQYVQFLPVGSTEDIVYHVLHVCEQYGVNKQELLLELAGFLPVNHASVPVLQELFPKMEWQDAAWMAELAASTYPLYYFTPFFNSVA